MRSLANEGVDTIFGYPGGAIMPVFDALYHYTRGDNKVFNHILVRHEQAAAHAAEGYSRVSGKVGVCIVTSGPGATNTVTGVADALTDGATFGAPGRTVCMFTGDGGFQMNIQELGTIMEQQTPVKVILLNNNYLGNVRQWQDMFFGGRRSFTRMMNPQYELICKGYNIPYGLAVTHEELKGEIEKMLSTDGPYVLECAVLEEDNVMPMVPPGKPINEMILGKEDFKE